MANGLFQFRDKTYIKCTDVVTNAALTGSDKCMYKSQNGISDIWVSRKDNYGQDQPQFRTLGKKVKEEVLDADIKCLAADFKTVRAGAANCWPLWLEGQAVNKVDQYLWLTTEGVACKNALGNALTGVDKCKIAKEVPCGASRIKRLNLQAGQICVPTYTWAQKI